MAQYYEMKLDVDGVVSTVWQKVAAEKVQVVTQQVVTYVDADGVTVDLPDAYEMQVVTGIALDAPGGGA